VTQVQGGGGVRSTNRGVDAVSSLLAGRERAQATFDVAAERLARADLPTVANPDPTAPDAPDPSTNVDPAEQLVTMIVAADMHHATTAALRSALSMYRTYVEMLDGDVT
jgi:flagellar basal body rod protein FlgC